MKSSFFQRHLRAAVLLLLVVAGGLTACSEPPYTNISNAQLQTLLQQGYALIDIRRPDEWRQTGVVEGSRLMTFVDKSGRVTPNFLESLRVEYLPGNPVILICRTGSRTRTLATYMVEELGYTDVYNVRGGITQWISDGLPVAPAR